MEQIEQTSCKEWVSVWVSDCKNKQTYVYIGYTDEHDTKKWDVKNRKKEQLKLRKWRGEREWEKNA